MRLASLLFALSLLSLYLSTAFASDASAFSVPDVTHTHHFVSSTFKNADGSAATLFTYARSNPDGSIKALGFAFPEFESGENLSLPACSPGIPSVTDFIPYHALDHPDVDGTAFTVMGFDFNPCGHPGGLSASQLQELFSIDPTTPEFGQYIMAHSSYLTPHFDLHAHVQPLQDILAMNCPFPQCNPGNSPEFFNLPDTDYIPSGFIPDPIAAVPAMGLHWERAEGNTPEHFLQEPAVIYGSYDGEATFWEIMPATGILSSTKTNGIRTGQWPLPSVYPSTASYPTRWELGYDEASGYHTFELAGFEKRNGVKIETLCKTNQATVSSDDLAAVTLKFKCENC